MANQQSLPPGSLTRRNVFGLSDRVSRILTAVLLALLLGGVSHFNRTTIEGEAADLGRLGFRFTEVSETAGISFTHKAPTLDSVLEPIMPLVASMGAAVSVTDFDNDGWPDIYVVTSSEGGHNALFRNLGNGSFEDVAQAMGVADVNTEDTGVSMGSVWADITGNGYEDMLLYKWGRPELFINHEGTGFERITDSAGLPPWMNANAAVWLDYDQDGRLDLFIAGYYDENINLWQLESTRMMPDSFEYARNGGRNVLLRNVGDNRFEDVSEAMGFDTTRWTLAVAAADVLGTGYPDLLIANDYGVPEYWLNEAGRRFREVGRETGLAVRPKSGMNMSLGDVFNDGRQALFITNISAAGQLVQGNNLWVPMGEAGDGLPRFVNMAEGAGVALGGWAFGAQFGDLNNDGSLDLFQTNGYVSADPKRSYWYDMSKVAIGNQLVIADAKNWPSVDGRSLSGHEPKHVWINDGLAQFQEVSAQVGVTELYDGRAVAMADFWNRGVLDTVVAHQNGPLLLYRNQVKPGRNWIGFHLHGAGANTSAIGARVTVHWDGKRQVQQIDGGSGFASQNQRRLHFGLGEDAIVERAEIRWSSGQTQVLDVPKIERYHDVYESPTVETR